MEWLASVICIRLKCQGEVSKRESDVDYHYR